MSAYFKYFPTVVFNNTYATNAITKLRFAQFVREKAPAFYTYTIQEGERPDTIAARYYNDPELDWLIYLANDIIDPYYDWPLTQSTFDRWMVSKYGSVELANVSTAFYRNNYTEDERIIATATYDAMSAGQKRYWNPVLDYKGSVSGYERAHNDWTVETNRVIRLTGDFDPPSVGDVVFQGSSKGTVCYASTSELQIKHVDGTWNTTGQITKAVTGEVVAASITAADFVRNENNEPIGIKDDELAYWSPVSYYDHHADDNEKKKHIRILHSSYVTQVLRDVREVLL